jgi:hypothetical protein
VAAAAAVVSEERTFVGDWLFPSSKTDNPTIL